MLDRWLKVITQRLGSYSAAVHEQRVRIERERASDTARDHAGREFINPEGYTTPLPKNAENKQKEYARARREFEEANLPRALAAAVTLMIARERRDEAKAALKAHLDAQDFRLKTGVHAEVAPFFDDMFEHGIEPRRLPYVRAETRAIIFDIIMWDGNDPEMLNLASPMPAIFELYAARLILKPGQHGDRSRSTIGTPVAQKRYTDPEYYMFNEIVPGSASPVIAPSDDANGAGEAEPGEDGQPSAAESMDRDRALAIAGAVFRADPFKMRIYWPIGIEQGDFNPDRLIPALEQQIAAGRSWSGVENFLEAARRNEAREFINKARQDGIGYLAKKLVDGDERAIEEARRWGVLD